MDWDAPAIVLDARPFGEGDAIATVMTEEHGLHRGLARGGASRAQAGLWQPGNLVQVRWVARLSDQLGSFSAEMIHAGAAFVMDDPLALAMLSAVCAVAEGALPEREPHPRVFHGLVHLVARLPLGTAMLNRAGSVGDGPAGRSRLRPRPASCAVTGATAGLAYVSPRTGRAVTAAAAGVWKSRLLRLPGFLAGGRHRRSGGLARRAGADRPLPGARRVRRAPPPAAPGAADAIRPRRRAGGRIGPRPSEGSDAG